MPKKDKNIQGGPGSQKKGKVNANTEGEKGTTKLKGAQQICVRHILCEKYSRKEEVIQMLKEGKKFDEVARKFSEDKARVGGALGWKKRGDLDPVFEDAAFGLEISTTASPNYAEVKTGFGYHILMVEGRK